MEQEVKSIKLGEIAIALGMKLVDYNTKTEYGAEYHNEISESTLKKQSEEKATKVFARLRKMSKVSSDVPILVGIYKNAELDR